MLRSRTFQCLVAVALSLATGAAASAQTTAPAGKPASSGASPASGELRGTVIDNDGQPLSGVVVTAIGPTRVIELGVSDAEGHFTFRNLILGSYDVRARKPGYAVYKGRYVQIAAAARQNWSIAMRPLSAADRPAVLAAGIGTAPRPVSASDPDDRDPSETAWRLRQIPRGPLKSSGQAVIPDDSFEDPLAELRRVVDSPTRLASALFSDLSVSGQVNVLTATSFNRAQDLFSMTSGTPRPVAFISLAAPTEDGNWSVRGALTQGDVSSWIVAGSLVRRFDSAHRYEAGALYSTQMYQGGNQETLFAMSEGRRTAGEIYVYDTWSVSRRLTMAYGGKYASYLYLKNPDLLSGRFSVSFLPSPEDPLVIRVSAAHREVAPGAEEFMLPNVGPWVPPERTFSPLTRDGLRPESVDHVEIAGEGQARGDVIIGVRAFRQRVDDQIVTLFGLTVAEAPATLGHYHVGTVGSFQTFGWGVSVKRTINGSVQGSIEYTQFQVSPVRNSPDEDALSRLSPVLLRKGERVHDLTATLNTRLAVTATRFLVVYKLNTAYAQARTMGPTTDARFEVQVNQELPFLDFTGAHWEMLAGIRNLFRSELFDGSVYDELLVVRPPKRIVGGVTVRF